MNILKNFQRHFCLILALCFTAQLLVATPFAAAAGLSKTDQKAIDYNWEHWVADPVCTASTSNIPLTGNSNAEKAFNYFIQKGLTPQQSAGIVGNLVAESQVDPTAQQDGSNTAYPKPNVGFGIAQWTTWDRQKALMDYAKQQNALVTDLGVQLAYLWQELNTGYKSTLTQIKATDSERDAAVIFMLTFERPLDQSIQKQTERANLASDVLGEFGGNDVAATSTTNSVTGCMVGSGAIAGDIVQTALGYAWPDTGHGPNESDAKPAYQADMPKFNGSTGDMPFSDCGVFVATVMIASGVDKDFPRRVTGIQMLYMQDHPEKYQPLHSVTDTSQLQPGDILVNYDHTYFYVGMQSNQYDSVAASLHDHVPQVSSFYGGFQGFRPINSSASTGGL